MAGRQPGLQADRSLGPTDTSRRRRSSASRISMCTRDRRSSRSTAMRSTSLTSIMSRPDFPEPELHRRTLRPAAARRFLLDRGTGNQRLWRPGGRPAVHPCPPRLFHQRHLRTAVLARREQDFCLAAITEIWTPRWLVEQFMAFELPDEVKQAKGVDLTLESKKKILGLNAARLYGIDVEAQKKQDRSRCTREGSRVSLRQTGARGGGPPCARPRHRSGTR